MLASKGGVSRQNNSLLPLGCCTTLTFGMLFKFAPDANVGTMKSSASIDKDDIVEEYEYDSSELIGEDEVEGESKLSVNVELENVGSLNSLSSLVILFPRYPRRAASFLF